MLGQLAFRLGRTIINIFGSSFSNPFGVHFEVMCNHVDYMVTHMVVFKVEVYLSFLGFFSVGIVDRGPIDLERPLVLESWSVLSHVRWIGLVPEDELVAISTRDLKAGAAVLLVNFHHFVCHVFVSDFLAH